MATIKRQSKYLYDSTGDNVLLPKVIIQDLMYPKEDPSSFDPDNKEKVKKGAEAVASCLEGESLIVGGLTLTSGATKAELKNGTASITNGEGFVKLGKNVEIGDVTGTSPNGTLVVGGQITAKSGGLSVTGDSVFYSKMNIASTTSSSSTTTGALVVEGGLGVGQNINCGVNANVSGKITGGTITSLGKLVVNNGGMSVTGSSEFKGDIKAYGYTIYAKTLEVSENVNVQNDVNARGFLRTWKDIYVGCDNSGNSYNRISTNANYLQLLSSGNEVMIYGREAGDTNMWVNYRSAPSGYKVPTKFVFAKGERSGETTNRSDIACGALECAGEAKAKVNKTADVYLGVPIGAIMMWPGDTAPDCWAICNGESIIYTGSTSSPSATSSGCKLPKSVNSDGTTKTYFTLTKDETQRLIDIIKTKYGYYTDLGSQRLCIPDFRGMIPIGAGTGKGNESTSDSTNKPNFILGESGHNQVNSYIGEYKHKLTANESGIQKHTHPISTNGEHHHRILRDGGNNNHTHGIRINDASSSKCQYVEANNFGNYTENAGEHSHTITNVSADAINVHNNIQPYQTVHFIIKVK